MAEERQENLGFTEPGALPGETHIVRRRSPRRVLKGFLFLVVSGALLAVAVWGDAREAQAFPVIEITTVSGRYDYASKYTKGASTHIIPARIPLDVTERVQQLAVDAFRACGCRGVARADMMLGEDMTPYVIEINSMPGMTETSLVPDAGRAMGVEFPELCERILEMAGYEK